MAATAICTKTINAAKWLRRFFDLETVSTFYGTDVPVGTNSSVIGLPYGEQMRVRFAFKSDGKVDVEVSHCPTGTRMLVETFDKWVHATQKICNAVELGLGVEA